MFDDLKPYTAWGAAGHANTLVSGAGPARGLDGTPDEDCREVVWHILAVKWSDACAVYHRLQGWEPYKPMLDGDGRPIPDGA